VTGIAKWNAVPFAEPRELAVIGDDRGNVDRQRSRAVAIEQVVEAVIEPGHQDQHAIASCGIVDPPLHSEARGNGGEVVAQSRQGCHFGHLEDGAHEKAPRRRVAEMRGFGDEDAAPRKKAGHRGDDAGRVGAGGRENRQPWACHTEAAR
jgi:hypothetical protein